MIRGKVQKVQIVIERVDDCKTSTYTIWTAENVGINRELRGSILPTRLLDQTFPDLIDWILAKHGRAHQRTLAARAARNKNSSRIIVHDKIVLHKAEKGRG